MDGWRHEIRDFTKFVPFDGIASEELETVLIDFERFNLRVEG